MFSLCTDPQFFLRGGGGICTQAISCLTSTPVNHSFFCRIPAVLENRRLSQGGGGGAIPYNLPLDPPLGKFVISVYTDKAFKYPPQESFKFGGSETPFPTFAMRYVSEKFDLEN